MMLTEKMLYISIIVITIVKILLKTIGLFLQSCALPSLNKRLVAAILMLVENETTNQALASLLS